MMSGAFRHVKYNPNMVAMHTCRTCGYGQLNTGGAFGDCFLPPNWDAIKCARQESAAWVWQHDPLIHEKISPLLPPITLSPPPTPEEVSTFTQVDRDDLNPGVLNPDGSRKPPTFPMQVDDLMQADVEHYIHHSVYSSAAGLFDVLGYPDPRFVTVLSMEKLETQYTYHRKLVGRHFDSRRLTVGMLPYKRQQLIEVLTDWSRKRSFDIIEVSCLLGTLNSHTKYSPSGRTWFFCLQNAARRILVQRYAVLRRLSGKYKAMEQHLEAILPPGLEKCLCSLLAPEKAAFLWATRQKHRVTWEMAASIKFILNYVQTTDSPWEASIPQIIPRRHHIESWADACTDHGAGGACPLLEFWVDVAWTSKIRLGVKLKVTEKGYVHINSLEFLIHIAMTAGVVISLEEGDPELMARAFPNGVPHCPAWLAWTDNMVAKSWENRATSASSTGQALIGVYTALLERANLHVRADHVPGKKNVLADDISRNDFSLPLPARLAKLSVKHPFLANYRNLMLSRKLKRLLFSKLFSGPAPEPIVLPKNLGQLRHVSSTTLDSQWI